FPPAAAVARHEELPLVDAVPRFQLGNDGSEVLLLRRVVAVAYRRPTIGEAPADVRQTHGYRRSVGRDLQAAARSRCEADDASAAPATAEGDRIGLVHIVVRGELHTVRSVPEVVSPACLRLRAARQIDRIETENVQFVELEPRRAVSGWRRLTAPGARPPRPC